MVKQNQALYNGKTIVIMGLTPSAVALAKLLQFRGARVKISEANPKDQVLEPSKELALVKPDVEAEFGRHSPQFFEGADMVVLSPTIRPDTKPLDEVKARGIPVLSDIELLCKEIEVPVVVFAGTEGKTTAAFLARAFLEKAGKKVFYSGDHGELLATFFLEERRADMVFLELSAAQLENQQHFRPTVVALTSLQPPFPERAPSLELYSAALKGLLKNLDEKCYIVYNFRDANLKQAIAGSTVPKRVYRRKDPVSLGPDIAKIYKGSYLANNGRELVWTDSSQKHVFNLRQLNLFGMHNKDNLMAAVNVAKIFDVSNEVIQRVIDTFPGVPHRLEFVKKRGGVRLVNDSRCVNVDGLRRALESFPLDPIILIAGGRDAQADFSSLVDVVKGRVRTLILVGEAKEHINRCIGDHSETFLVGTFEEGVLLSYQKSKEGDVILLSPGCESYDMFVSYEERGNYFKKYVEEL